MTYRPPTAEVQAAWEHASVVEIEAIVADEMDNPRQTCVVKDWSDPFDPTLQRHVKGSRFLRRGEFFVEATWNTKQERVVSLYPRLFLAVQDGRPMVPGDVGTGDAWGEHRYAGAVRCCTFAFAYEENAVVTVEGVTCFRHELQVAAEAWRARALEVVPADEVPYLAIPQD